MLSGSRLLTIEASLFMAADGNEEMQADSPPLPKEFPESDLSVTPILRVTEFV
jgi:hypothetical protein